MLNKINETVLIELKATNNENLSETTSNILAIKNTQVDTSQDPVLRNLPHNDKYYFKNDIINSNINIRNTNLIAPMDSVDQNNDTALIEDYEINAPPESSSNTKTEHSDDKNNEPVNTEDMKTTLNECLAENVTLKSLIQSYEKEKKEQNIEFEKIKANSNREIERSRKLENSIKEIKEKYTSLNNEHQSTIKQVDGYIMKNVSLTTDKENLKKFIFKTYQIFELNSDLNLNDALFNLNCYESDRRKLNQSYMSLKNEYQALLNSKIQVESELKKASDQINRINSQMDDQKLMYLSKEQQNVILCRQIEQYAFTQRITPELIHQLEMMGSNVNSYKNHIEQLKHKLTRYSEENNDLLNQLNDLQSHCDIITTFHNENQTKLQSTRYELEFLIQSQYDLCSNYHNKCRVSNTNSNQPSTSSNVQVAPSLEIIHFKNEIDKLKNNSSISTKRYLSIISDLRKQIKQLQFELGHKTTPHNKASDYLYETDYIKSNGFTSEYLTPPLNSISDINIKIKNYDIETLKNAHAALQTQYMLLNEDVNDLKVELMEKNKLVDKLIHHQTFDLSACELELSNGKSGFMHKLKQVLPINLNYPDINQLIEFNTQLKIELEDTFMKNILLKENIITLGNEIHRLNQELISRNQAVNRT